MSKQTNYDVITENEIGYLKAGDYFIPTIEPRPIEVKRLGKYGRRRRAFLQEYNPMLLNDLVLTEQLFPHLYEVQEIAEKRVQTIMEGLLEKNSAPEKEIDAMAWTRHMNMLKAMRRK